MGEPDDRQTSGDQAGHGGKHVFDACADSKKALPEWTIADDPGWDAAGMLEAP
jgi:hypothetical protein